MCEYVIQQYLPTHVILTCIDNVKYCKYSTV